MKTGLTRIITLALAPLSAQPAAEAKAAKPNILFLFSDDHALRTIGAYEGSINKTPNPGRIAHEGGNFTDDHLYYLKTARIPLAEWEPKWQAAKKDKK